MIFMNTHLFVHQERKKNMNLTIQIETRCQLVRFLSIYIVMQTIRTFDSSTSMWLMTEQKKNFKAFFVAEKVIILFHGLFR